MQTRLYRFLTLIFNTNRFRREHRKHKTFIYNENF